MARYNKIYLGPWREAQPQAREALFAVDTLPGCLVKDDGSNQLTPVAAGDKGKFWIVQDNYLAMKGVDDVWKAGSRGIGLELLDEQFFAARIPTGVNIAAVGTPLAPGADGKFKIAATGELVVATADEVYNNDTGADQLIKVRPAQSYIVPA